MTAILERDGHLIDAPAIVSNAPATMPKVTAKLADLITAVAAPAGLVGHRPPVDILAFIVLDAASDGTVTFHGTNYEQSIGVRVKEAADVTPGRAAVHGHHLLRVLRSLRGAAGLPAATSITLDTQSRPGWVMVTAAGGWSVPVRQDALGDYPSTPTIDPKPWDDYVQVLGIDLMAGFKFVSPAVSRDETLPILTAVNVEFDGARLRLSGTDRYRLASTSVNIDSAAGTPPARSLMRLQSVQHLLKYLTGGMWRIEYGSHDLAKDVVRVTDDEGTTIAFWGQDGDYPKLAGLMAAKSKTVRVEVDRLSLLRLCRFTFQQVERNIPGRLVVADGTATFFPRALDDDAPPTGTPKVPAKLIAGGDLETAFNPAFLRDLLETFTGGTVVLAFEAGSNGPIKPMLVADANDDESKGDRGALLGDELARRALLMPIRTG